MTSSLQVRILILSKARSKDIGYLFLSLNELVEKPRLTVILGNFVKKL